MLKQRLQNDLKEVVRQLGYQTSDIDCYIPKNLSFGDYSTNIPLQLAKLSQGDVKQTPLDIANKIIKEINKKEVFNEYLEKAESLGGFINFTFKKEALMKNVHQVCDYSYLVKTENPAGVDKSLEGEKILLEYAQPNTHKAFHIGHTRNIILGESVARFLESQGNKVYRCTYGSDIGLPVAKAIWGVLSMSDEFKAAKNGTIQERAEFLGKAYAFGATSYEKDQSLKLEIDGINKQLYLRSPKYLKLWEETRGWSLDYLDSIYTKLGTKFDGVFVESQVEGEGKRIVLDNIGKVFEEDQGAVIFPGEKYGLHNRVFITSAGNPTYEGKEIGLAKLEHDHFSYDKSIHVVDVQQEGYFKVVIKVIDLLFPDLAGKKYHLAYGFVDLMGRKMSSRTGDVVTFDYLFEEVRQRVAKIMSKSALEEKDQIIDMISIGAIKFTMLKYSPQTKIYFDLESSVALDGDSGPYLQYTYARAKSVLRTAAYNYQPEVESGDLEKEERQLLQKVEHFPVIVADAAANFNPTTLSSFLLDLAKAFNLFYQKHPIIKAIPQKVEFRLALTCSVAVLLKQGLYLLGIEAPERM